MANNSEGSEKLESLDIYNPILPHQTNIYFTVLNVIQAIAFGFLLLKSAALVDEFSWSFFFRAVLVSIIIVIVWHRYATESQFLWPLTWMDTLIPFWIGAISFFCVFSADSKISLSFFLFFIVVIELSAIAAYWNALRQRQRKNTQHIYLLFFQEKPEIGKRLILVLISFDYQNILWFLFLVVCSIVLLVLSSVYYHNWYEVVFPLVLAVLLIIGETRIRIQKHMAKDPVLKLYFE